jgi:hypothetical protein
MSKKKNKHKNKNRHARAFKANKKLVITSQQQFDAEKPRYNGFACGYGRHGDKKYNRAKEKRRHMNNGDDLG